MADEPEHDLVELGPRTLRVLVAAQIEAACIIADALAPNGPPLNFLDQTDWVLRCLAKTEGKSDAES